MELRVEGSHVPLFGGQVFFRVDCVDRALGYAHSAVNARFRVDGEEVRAFNKTIYGADIYAVGVFAADAAFGHNVGHVFLNSVSGWGETFKVYRHVFVPRRTCKGVTVRGVGELVQ